MGIYETFRQRYEHMMSGEAVCFSENQVWDMLTHLDYFQINTLMIQEDGVNSTKITKWFVCKVDEATKKAYLKEKEQEMRPLG
jgi:hypothetical protein